MFYGYCIMYILIILCTICNVTTCINNIWIISFAKHHHQLQPPWYCQALRRGPRLVGRVGGERGVCLSPELHSHCLGTFLQEIRHRSEGSLHHARDLPLVLPQWEPREGYKVKQRSCWIFFWFSQIQLLLLKIKKIFCASSHLQQNPNYVLSLSTL